ncbi:glycosyl hydrolase [Draconibacterium sediminis]|uniref:Glycoside hydrolase n=1 Tax=Draconibacterium sediminis TaxID=1544798 RepID=A0A0D8JCJ3_9BACT|nr:glycosyl hydrolase [Draconibacterium sediminis]KJF43523.1 hypothetical protein LH29_15050 [Draconibacterium sediminis]
MKLIHLISLIFVCLLFSCQSQQKTAFLSEEEFKNPSDEYKPRTWFHAMSGNMSKAGLTKDLEAIEKVGIGGILLFNVTQGIPNGPIKYNSPEHHDMLKHAAAECERLGLSFGVHNCDGWSSSGGPWITPEQSMKMVVWSETITNGGEIDIQLPQPTTRKNYYEDIAVLAYPSLQSEITDFENQPRITTSDKNFDIKIATDNRLDATSVIKKEGDKNPWIQFEYDKPHEIRSVFLVFNDRNGEAVLQVSDDGKNFTSVRELYKVRTGKGEWAINDSFEAIKSKYFRLSLNQTITFKEAKLLSTQCLHNVLGRTSMARTEDVAMSLIGKPASEMIIEKNKLINLTEQMDSGGQLQANLPEGSWTIMRFGYTTTDAFNHPASDEGRGLECDKFSREAFKIHYNAFAKKVIENTKAVAPNAMQYIEIDSYEMGGQNWTQNYNTIFKEKKGYDIVEFLPLFAGRFVESAEVSDAVLWDLRDVNCELMTENYFSYFAELCNNDGIKSYIEPYGFGPVNDLDVGGKADINMGEFWMNRDITMVQSAVSASHIYGKTVTSAESFTSDPQINWKGNPAMAKVSGDLAWAHGINEFMFHRFAHQANTHVKPGMTMNRWGFHFDRTQTWWENAGADWFKYMARGQYLLRQGVPVSDFLVFVGDGSPNSVYLRTDFEPEIPAGINFDCTNTDVLQNRIQLKNNKMVLPEGTEYKVLVLQNCETLTMETLQRIYEISQAGVVIVGTKPIKLAGHSKSNDERLAFEKLSHKIWENNKVYTDYNWSNIMRSENIDSDFEITDRIDIPFIHRRLNGEDIYFFFNPDSTFQHFECSFRIEGKIPELWNPMTGETQKTAQFTHENGNTKVWINLEAEESVFVVFRESSDGVPTVSEVKKLETGNFVLNTNNELQLETESTDNPLQIDGSWEVEFLQEHDYQATHIFDKLTDWKENTDDNIKYYSGTAIYRKAFSVNEDFIKENTRYILDLGDVKIVAQVKLNGANIGVDWMPPFELDITEYLKTGENQLEIRITNQWSNKLIGDERFPPSYTGYKLEGNFPKGIMMDWYANNEPMPAGKRTTFCTASFYKADDELMPSGLLGPVRIITEKIEIINK